MYCNQKITTKKGFFSACSMMVGLYLSSEVLAVQAPSDPHRQKRQALIKEADTLELELHKLQLSNVRLEKQLELVQQSTRHILANLPPIAPVSKQVATLSEASHPLELNSPNITMPIVEDAEGVNSEQQEIILRSRSLGKQFTMKEIANNIYEAEILINPGVERAEFDVNQRTYRGKFPSSDEPTVYVFTFDQSSALRPRMDIKQKAPDQIAINSD